jgi:hypothetical protein
MQVWAMDVYCPEGCLEMGIADWTDIRLAMLRQLIGGGASCNEAAAQINAATRSSFTRNAIIGKVQRLKIVSPNKLGRPVLAKKPVRDRKIKVRRPVPTQSPPAFRAEPPGPQDVIPPKPFKLRELHGFTAERCTYTDDCTDRPVKGRFYCQTHCMIVYRPATPPRDATKPFPRPTTRSTTKW